MLFVIIYVWEAWVVFVQGGGLVKLITLSLEKSGGGGLDKVNLWFHPHVAYMHMYLHAQASLSVNYVSLECKDDPVLTVLYDVPYSI